MNYGKPHNKEYCRNASMVLVLFICMTLYSAYIVMYPSCELSGINLITAGASLCIVFASLNHVLSHGVRVWSVFLVVWFAFLAFNSLNISEMQIGKSMGDLYYYVFLPLLFAAVLAPAEQCEIPFFSEVRNSARIGFGLLDAIALLVILAYIVLRVDSIEQTGVRFLTPGFGAESPEKIGADGSGSGLVSLLMWLVILLGSNAQSKFVRYLSMAVIGASCLLFLKRGVVVKVVLYFVLFYLGKRGVEAFSKKGFAVFLVAVIVGCGVFALWGDARQHARGASSDYSISAKIESRIDNDVVSWVYAYTSLNYDVLKQCYIDQTPTGEFEELLKPVNRIVLGEKMYEGSEEDGVRRDLNGFNAPTFLGPFVEESGPLACFSILLLGLVVRITIALSLRVGSAGVYYLTMATASLALFSNSFTSPYIVYAIMISLGILWFDRSAQLSTLRLRRIRLGKVHDGE